MATESVKRTITSFLLAMLEKDDGQSWEDLSDEELFRRFNGLKLSLQNHEETVQQNRNLQTQLTTKEAELKKIKEAPFFPYVMNDGGRAEYKEFYLISHAWFTIPNLPALLGIVEVEWKSSGIKKMYLGVGSTNGKNFNKDVASIVFYGQKIKDSSEV